MDTDLLEPGSTHVGRERKLHHASARKHGPSPMLNLLVNSLPGIEVRISNVHGLGVFALCDLPAGAFIGHYEGQRFSEAQANRISWDNRLTYLFGLSDGTILDGARGGNATRHLNHACDPNCEAVEERDGTGKIVLRIETMRPIAAGGELSIDYALTVDDEASPADYMCSCGSARCRGTMLAGASSN